MIGVSFKFLAGRYHATPWGRHVNEGAVEWPPSPWRILRAIVATWKRTLPGLSEQEVRTILEELVDLPQFLLPPASTGHARHYMPLRQKGGSDNRTLVFDSFVVVPRDAPLIVRWPRASLNQQQRAVLARILGNLNHLGRSESWCEAELVEDIMPPGSHACCPLQGDLPATHEIVRLLCPDSASAFADDHVVTINTKTIGRGRNKKTVEQKVTIYDPAWNLCIETLKLHEERWSDPPGSQWVPYARPCDCFKIEPKRRTIRAPSSVRITVIRYALDSSVLPLVTETLPVAEAARRTLMGLYGRHVWQRLHGSAPYPRHASQRPRSKVLSGKDRLGNPLKGHVHAYYLPTDEDGDGRLDHLTLYAANGFNSDELCACDKLRELRTGRQVEENHPVQVLLLAMGIIEEFNCAVLQKSKVWASATPYIATRYAKTRGRRRIDLRCPEARAEFLIEDLRAQLCAVRPELANHVTVTPLWDQNRVFLIANRWRPIQFKRFRRKVSDDGGRRLAGAFQLEFPEPVAGPIALGWSSHFGLGLFLPSSGSDTYSLNR